MTIETVTLSETVRARIEQDNDPMSPDDWDNLGSIAYVSTRNTLGTERVSRGRLDEIAAGIRDGSLIGMPVYAYIHSGATVSTKPFSCPWDSGQSGFVYVTKEKAIKEFGNKILTARIKANVLKCLVNEVEAYDQYLTGDVYGVVVEHRVGGAWVEAESCWGMYGLEYAREEAHVMGAHTVLMDGKEAAQRAEWEARGVMTVA
jgi:hypothetical protein